MPILNLQINMYCVPGTWSILDTYQLTICLSNIFSAIEMKYYLYFPLCYILAIDYKNKFYSTQQWFAIYLFSAYNCQVLSLQEAGDIKINETQLQLSLLPQEDDSPVEESDI